MKKFDVMDACWASAKDFCDTLLFCLEEDGIFTKEDGSLDENFRKEYKEYLDECGYYDEEDLEEKLTLLQEEGQKIEKWLKENDYADECIDAGFEPIEGHQGRIMTFGYNGNIDELCFDGLATLIAENVIDDRFSVRVSPFVGKEYEDQFCVEILLNE